MTIGTDTAIGSAVPPSAEPVRLDERPRPGPWSPRVLLALLLLAGAAIAAVLLVVAAHGLNRIARETEGQVARAILDDRLDELAQTTLDRAWPRDTSGTGEPAGDAGWAARGRALVGDADTVFLIDTAGTVRFANHGGTPPAGAERLTAVGGVAPDGRPRPAAGVLLVDGVPHMVAVAPLRPAGTGTLVVMRAIDRAVLDRQARRFLLPGLRAVADTDVAGMPLAAPDGTPAGTLVWTGARPGDALTGWLLPALLVAGGLIGALAWRIAAAWQDEQRRAALLRTRLAAVLDGAADAMVLFDAAGRVADVNRAAEYLFGRPEAALLDLPLDALLRGSDGDVLTLERLTDPDPDGGLSTGGPGYDLLATRGGAAVPVEVRVSRIPCDGAPLYSAVMRDITLRKELENRLRAAKEAAEMASRAKSQFVAAMSHELRTPLNAIIGFSEIIRKQALGPLGDPHYASYAEDIHEGAAYLLAVINDILDIARVEAGEMELTERTVTPAAVVASCLRLMRDRAERGGVTLADEVDDATPAVLADERLLKQMLVNLLSNAVKFTPPGGTVRVQAATTTAGGLAISVADTGEGIGPEVLERVFAPFVQADNRLARGHEGTGLGLPLTKALIERHGGWIELDSHPGRGTVATLVLPPGRVLGRDGTAAG